MSGTTRLQHVASGDRLRRRTIGILAAAALAATTLTGCAAGMISQTADQIPNHDGSQAVAGQVGVHNVLLAAPTAVTGDIAWPAGSTVPVTLVVTNNAITADTLTSISSSAGAVTVSGDATIPAQGSLTIGGDSAVSAEITSTTADLKYGFPVTMDFYFTEAGKISLAVSLATPAERAADREGTDIYPAEETNLWGEAD